MLATEQALRSSRTASGGGAPLAPSGKPSLGAFTVARPERGRLRLFRSLVLAAVIAVVVGFAGYAISAAAGINEPTATAPVQVSSGELAEQAQVLAGSGDLSSHLLSGAWRCANRVISGRIRGMVSALVDGRPALLVYTSHDGAKYVVVVSGCPRDEPSAGPSVRLPG